MANIWLVQYLCPQRHAICATPYEQPIDANLTATQALIEVRLLDEMQRLYLEPRCGICGSRDLHFEHGKLATRDWTEALRLLKAGERANIATRAAIERERQRRN